MARRGKPNRRKSRAESRDLGADASKLGKTQSSTTTFWIALALVLAVIAVYSDSFSGPFIFDDLRAITDNPTIRQLWPLGSALSPPQGVTTAGRPLLNLTFAVNYAANGESVWGYHATNVAIHIINALLLFGVLRQTLVQPAMSERFGDAATALAFLVALFWALHPLQTESVAYIVQRAESLVALFYLLTLYCVVRGCQSTKPNVWYAGAVIACLFGMSSKEVMVTAPVLVLLYDRQFLAGSFRMALWSRRWLYAGMALTWILLAYLITSAGDLSRLYSESGIGSGQNKGGLTPLSYAATQPGVILHYLRLAIWPNPLVLDYDWKISGAPADILATSLVVGLLVAATLWGVISRKPWGFLGAWFFVILSPTSSVVPLEDLIFEHRMYLPLAAVLAGFVLVVYRGGRHLVDGRRVSANTVRYIQIGLSVVVAVTLSLVTFWRLEDYGSATAIYRDTVEKAPNSARAHSNLGHALAADGKVNEAIEQYRAAIRLKPDLVEAHNNLGLVFAKTGRMLEAIARYEDAIRIKPRFVEARVNLADALVASGRAGEAIGQYEEALRLRPDYVEVYVNLGVSLLGSGRPTEAIPNFLRALKLKPALAEAHYNLGLALQEVGRTEEAIEHYQEALRLKPDYAQAPNNIGVIFFRRGNFSRAIEQFDQALRIEPKFEDAKSNRAKAIARAQGKP